VPGRRILRTSSLRSSQKFVGAELLEHARGTELAFKSDRGTRYAGLLEVSENTLGRQFWINILLTLLGYIPGIVHAVWVIAKY
jgi:hypothetical protein